MSRSSPKPVGWQTPAEWQATLRKVAKRWKARLRARERRKALKQ